MRTVFLVGWDKRRAVASMVLPHMCRMAVSVLDGDAHAYPEGPAASTSDLHFDSGCSTLVIVPRSSVNHSVLSGGDAACAMSSEIVHTNTWCGPPLAHNDAVAPTGHAWVSLFAGGGLTTHAQLRRAPMEPFLLPSALPPHRVCQWV